MIKSLRWRLQIWHTIILASVLVIFGSVVYNLHWQTRLQQVDAELDRTADVLTSRLRRLFPGPPFRGPFRGPPRPGAPMTVPRDRRPPGRNSFDRKSISGHAMIVVAASDQRVLDVIARAASRFESKRSGQVPSAVNGIPGHLGSVNQVTELPRDSDFQKKFSSCSKGQVNHVSILSFLVTKA